MNKAFFRRIWRIITAPAAAWTEITEETAENKPYLSAYFYPLLAMVGIAAFLNPFIHAQENFRIELGQGIQTFIRVFTAYFASYFLSSLVLDRLFVRWLGMDADKVKAEKLSVYALTPLLLVRIFTFLIKDLFFLYIFVVYTVFIVWEASGRLYVMPNKQRGRFTALTTLVLLLSPVLIEFILIKLLPGLT
ncbi:MAG: YIP1 family protein [Bacteroidales bacterium]|nr:YIP1 family protein [Bacteroidales bacterium]MDD2617750.1 YIP1 family protein [Bacteroidales bacterium]MDD4640777.1 YIP1 family protein [Bacteroidales bacterium]NLB03341.1 DUF1282 family protein [Bacteroidales bacterium]